jgi:hypothetical protein
MMSEPDRADPLGDISDFAPAIPAKPKAPVAMVRKVSEANGFTARRAPAATRPSQRRHRTGRNAQLNLKVTPETLARFTAIADREKWLLAETLEHAIDALEMALARRPEKQR